MNQMKIERACALRSVRVALSSMVKGTGSIDAVQRALPTWSFVEVMALVDENLVQTKSGWTFAGPAWTI